MPKLLHHDRLGAGSRAVVLVHGFLGAGRNLRSLARRWQAREPSLAFVLPDLTGHGDSPPLPEGATLDDLARDVLGLAEHLGLARPYRLVGHSLGGRVALAVARRDPDAVAEAVLLDIPPGPVEIVDRDPILAHLLAAPARPEDRGGARDLLVEGGVSPEVADWLVMNLVHDAAGGYRWRIDREALAALSRRTNAEDLWPVVTSGTVRIREIRGARSPYVTDADVVRLEAASVPVDTVAGAGHFLHVDAPDVLLDLLDREW